MTRKTNKSTRSTGKHGLNDRAIIAFITTVTKVNSPVPDDSVLRRIPSSPPLKYCQALSSYFHLHSEINKSRFVSVSQFDRQKTTICFVLQLKWHNFIGTQKSELYSRQNANIVCCICRKYLNYSTHLNKTNSYVSMHVGVMQFTMWSHTNTPFYQQFIKTIWQSSNSSSIHCNTHAQKC